MYKFVNRADKAEVYLYGEIGEDFWGEGTSARTFAAQLAEVSPKPLDIRIDSVGGDVFEAFAMASAIQRYEGGTTAYVDGLAASAASYVAVVCDEVKMNDYAWMMIHRASAVAYGNVEDLENLADRLRVIDAAIAGVYAKRTGMTPDEVMDAMRNETWYNATEALENNFAQEVIETEERMAASLAARIDGAVARYKNIPEALRAQPSTPPATPAIEDADGSPEDPADGVETGASHATGNLSAQEDTAPEVEYFAIDGMVFERTKR